MQQLVLGSPYKAVIDTTPSDLFGIAGKLQAFVKGPSDTEAAQVAVTFSEVLESAPAGAPATIVLASDAPAGATVLSVDATATTLDAAMTGYVYQFSTSAGSFYVRVKEVDTTANTVTLAGPTPGPVATTDTVSFYGGTGVYMADIPMNDLGMYVVAVRADDLSVKVGATSVEVVPPPEGSTETVYARFVG